MGELIWTLLILCITTHPPTHPTPKHLQQPKFYVVNLFFTQFVQPFLICKLGFSHVCPTLNIPSELMNSPRPTKLYTLNKSTYIFQVILIINFYYIPPHLQKPLGKYYFLLNHCLMVVTILHYFFLLLWLGSQVC